MHILVREVGLNPYPKWTTRNWMNNSLPNLKEMDDESYNATNHISNLD
jgi:hypothetical protein